MTRVIAMLLFATLGTMLAPAKALLRGGTVEDLTVTATIDGVQKKVKGLHYNVSVPGHQATFAVSATATGAPAGFTYTYAWAGPAGVSFDDPTGFINHSPRQRRWKGRDHL